MTRKTKIRRAVILAVGLAGLALAVIPNGMRFTGYLCLGIAALWAIEELLIVWKRHSAFAGVLEKFFFTGVALVFAVIALIEIEVVKCGEADRSDQPVDAVIILGAGVNGETPSAALQSRIDAARAYLKKHPGIPVVLSGGKGSGENISEAEAMRRALWTGDGETDACLIPEDRSVNTAQNFEFSRALLAELGVDMETARIAIVTSDFHCYRTHLLAQRHGMNTVEIPAELPWWWLSANYYIREAFAVVKTVLFDWPEA